MPEAHARGVRIRYDDMGQGELALLFIPGWCCSRAIFHRLVPRCSARRRVLSVDLRGHGQSATAADFGREAMVEDLLAVISSSRAHQVVPVALSHGGWWALELRRRLGSRIPGLVLLDWHVLEPPAPFFDTLQALQSLEWQQARDSLFGQWLQGAVAPEVGRFVRADMGVFGPETWAQAARQIRESYAREGAPLRALERLSPPVPTLHLYSHSRERTWRAAQEDFAAEHPWFHAVELRAGSHFSLLETPDEVAEQIEPFVSSLAGPVSPAPASPAWSTQLSPPGS